MPKPCLFCNESNTIAWGDFRHCPSCQGVFLLPNKRLTPKEQKARYMLHHNDIESCDEGYRAFLTDFFTSVYTSVSEVPKRIIDYGSGPFPALSFIIKSFFEEKKIIVPEIRSWDPFFAPDVAFFSEGADVVCCLEVAEHFEEPQADFQKLASACACGGCIAIGTMPHSGNKEHFDRWWYKNDTTHVSFYTPLTIKILAQKSGLRYGGTISDRIFILHKPL